MMMHALKSYLMGQTTGLNWSQVTVPHGLGVREGDRFETLFGKYRRCPKPLVQKSGFFTDVDSGPSSDDDKTDA
jgi:hypothetical protein